VTVRRWKITSHPGDEIVPYRTKACRVGNDEIIGLAGELATGVSNLIATRDRAGTETDQHLNHDTLAHHVGIRQQDGRPL
jgi:hypothetical protein